MATLIENTASLPHPNTIDRPPIRARLRRGQDLAGSVRLPNRSIEMSSLIRSRIGRNGKIEIILPLVSFRSHLKNDRYHRVLLGRRSKRLPHAPAATHVQGFQRSLVLNNPGNSFSRVRTGLVFALDFCDQKSSARELAPARQLAKSIFTPNLCAVVAERRPRSWGLRRSSASSANSIRPT
jgi:hypothetical protein